MRKYSIILLIAISIGGCNDFLTRPQLTSETDETYWTNENNVRLFANGFYSNYFTGYNTGFAWDYVPGNTGGGYNFADDFANAGMQTPFDAQVPASLASTSEEIYMQSKYSGPRWNFAWVRKANLFLDRVNGMKTGSLTAEARAHWSAVARFFRGYEYSRLVEVFGNVPYYNSVVSDGDIAGLYKDRDDRGLVMDSVYNDFNYVLNNMRLSDGNAQYLNRYIAAGFISRFMLFEGTWQKYHNGDNTRATKYLQLAVQAGDLVINSGKWSFTSDFRSLFGAASGTLINNPEILLSRTYSTALLVMHSVASYANLSQLQPYGANLDLIKSFIAIDGQPYKLSSVPNATNLDIASLITTRDPRFEATFWKQPNGNSATLLYCDKFIDRTGPNDYATGASVPAQYQSSTNNNDAPVMRLAEVVLNWVEAKAELGIVTQTDLDASINAIRNRPLDATAIANGVQKTAPLSLAALPNDPDRDADVSALLWEIRRERRMEFVFEHTRLLDIKRWGKINYMDATVKPDILLGPWYDFNGNSLVAGSSVVPTSYLIAAKQGLLKVQHADGTVVTYDGTNAVDMVGYYIPVNAVNRDAFTDRVYLCPVGLNEIAQYQAKGYTLSQTAGWQ
ncbi:MAG: RagB/SusD family nutrient uptake outer membrane protein [Bacteroidetes bacterium]|nr:RagB/SusD family nutrient uptake outer membrane protein [Bacteroidota bacterium]